MLKVALVVPDPPPIRDDPGRAADRDSPHARALARAGEALVLATPEAFPVTFDGFLVTFGRTFPDVYELGYTPEQAIIEVLSDVGLVNEPEGWWFRQGRDDTSDFYVVALHTQEGST